MKDLITTISETASIFLGIVAAAWNRRVTQNIGKKECCENNEEQEV